MVKAFTWNAKDAGLSPAQHYSFPCQIASREKIIYNLFMNLILLHNNIYLTNLVDIHVWLDSVVERKYIEYEMFGGLHKTTDANPPGTKFYTHLLLDIKLRSLRYFNNLVQSVSTVKFNIHLIFNYVQNALNLSLCSY